MSPTPSLRLPRARPKSEFIVEEMADEVLVYDSKRDRAHCLNKAAALVWRHCDGRSSVQNVLKALAAEGLPAERAVLELAISELAKANLVEPIDPLGEIRFRSRRTMLKQLGLMAAASVALPIVQSIVAPSVAEAASCNPSATPCLTPGADATCCNGVCIPGSPPVCL
jgi:hypothetical protein